MPFSRESLNEIWRRSGGEQAECFTCGKKCKDGWSLDGSHLDHEKNHGYDDPSRGVLECLWCHLKRHAELYYKYAYNRDKRRLRDTKYACLALINRILAGEDIYNRGPQIRSRADIKQARKEIVALLNEVYKEQRKKVGRSDRAKEKFEELVNMAR